MTRAVVLGAGMSGILAAAALSRHVDEVSVVDSDRLPDSPQARRGLPQAHHNHVFMGGGAQALDRLLPGSTDALYAAGAHHRKVSQFLLLGVEVWSRRFDGDAYAITCSRHLVDHVVRSRALAQAPITMVESTAVVGLTGDASRVTGVRVERDGREDTIPADFVVDATGSRSKAPEWLRALGLPAVREEFLDIGLAYVGRTYAVPDGFGADFPGILIQARPGAGPQAAGGALMPQEDGRWIVAIMGTRGGQPPSDEDEFLKFARDMRHPIIGDLIASASPLGPLRSARGLANRRRHFHRLPVPEGFAAVGDAVMVLSPNFGTGMSVAVMGALALRTQLEHAGGLVPGLSRRVQEAVFKAGADAWRMAVTNDRWFTDVRTNLKLRGGDGQRRFGLRWGRMVADNEAVARATQDVSTLTAPLRKMMTVPALLAVARGPRRAPLTAAQAIAQFPQLRAVYPGTVPAGAGAADATAPPPGAR
jgi:2-polyprenyl-6-methoxyphenol hydroxylase-like FAD-dependent oxidoreductase